jgi:hypothetical protein
MKMMQGLAAFACSNRSRTRDAPTPTNISTKSEPAIEKKGTPASPATARARRVLPVPGGPTSRTPLGIFAPSAWNLPGFARNSLISWSSSTASSTPATSLNVMRGWSRVMRLAFALPNDITLLLPPCICWRKNHMKPTMSTIGSSCARIDSHGFGFCGSGVNLTSGLFAMSADSESSPM